MKKKILLTLAAIFFAACAFGFAACDGGFEEGHTHTYGEWIVVLKPTCTEKGMKESPCVDGDVIRQEEIPALGHDYEEVVTPPTCTEEGYTTYTCTRCGDMYVDDFVPALGHEYGKDGWCIRGDARQSVGLSYALNSSGTAYSIVGMGICEDTEVILPAVYQNLPVTAIAERAFENNTVVTGIVLSSNIESIGDNAFSGCSKLISVRIPQSSMTFGENAFSECGSLKDVYYGGSEQDFAGLHLSPEVTVHFNASSSEEGTVHKHTYQSVTVKPTCTEYGSIRYTCTVCGSYYYEDIAPIGHDYDTENIEWTWNTDHTSVTATLTCKNDESHKQTLEATVTSEITKEATYEEAGIRTYAATVVWEGAVYTDTATEEIPVLEKKPETLDYSLNEDGKSYSATGIGTVTDTNIVIPSAYEGLPVTAIGTSAFMNNTAITSVVIPDGVESIGSYAFRGCSGLTSVTIGNGVTNIGYDAFRGCSELTSVVIPDSVESIGSDAFAGCVGLADIYYTGTEEEWNAIDKSSVGIPSAATIHYNYKS